MPPGSSHYQKSGHYQPEIDGLRAIAILLVVLFHAGAPLPGGFVGVDVFFVLSGFLISRVLLTELHASGRIDFAAFYARRVRRLVPALLTVIVACLIIGTFVLSAADERQKLSQSAIAAATFIANIYFWRVQGGYFGPQSEWIPLLNMWTLSVEEQFYLVWPAFMLVSAVIGRRIGWPARTALFVATCFSCATSLAIYLWAAFAKPVAAFYTTPTRLWELALGALLLYIPVRFSRVPRGAGVAAVMILIAVTIAPGGLVQLRVLLAALSAAAIIVCLTFAPEALLSRALSRAPMVMLGRLSYSWYLWHWPLLVFANIYELGRSNPLRDAAMVLLTLGLAAGTYVAIENPIRHNRPWPFSTARQSLYSGGVSSVVVIALAFGCLAQANAVLARDPWLQAIQIAGRHRAVAPPGCHIPTAHDFTALVAAENCRIGAQGPPRLLLWGDSQAQHLAEMVRADAISHDYAAIVRSMGACPPTLSLDAGGRCSLFNRSVAHELPALAGEGLRGIVIGLADYRHSPRRAQALGVHWASDFSRTLAAAEAAGLRVLVIEPFPTIRRAQWPQCLARANSKLCGGRCDDWEKDMEPMRVTLREIVARHPNARLWRAWDLFCRDGYYDPVDKYQIFYSDSGHLSVEGSRYLVPFATEPLAWVRGQ